MSDKQLEFKDVRKREPSPVPVVAASSSSRRRTSVALRRRSSLSNLSQDIKTACLGIPPDCSVERKLNLMFEISFYHTLKSVANKSEADEDTIDAFSSKVRVSLPKLLKSFRISALFEHWRRSQASGNPTDVVEDNQPLQKAKIYKQESQAWNEAKLQVRLAHDEARKEYTNVVNGITVITNEQRAHLPEHYQLFLKGKPDYDALVSRQEKVLEELELASREIDNITAKVSQRIVCCQKIVDGNIRKLGESLGLHEDLATVIDDFYNTA